MIYLITGGQRSGKSSYAQKLALELDDNPTYVATARLWEEDEEFKQRIERHKADRDERWTNIECEKEFGNLDLGGNVAVIDCVTLWLTNFFMDTEQDVGQCLNQAKEQLKKLIAQGVTLIFITNEIGMGTHAGTEAGRKFTDLQGWMNQHIANRADKVVMMVSGIPLTIKEDNDARQI